jgi:hypothetical protein
VTLALRGAVFTLLVSSLVPIWNVSDFSKSVESNQGTLWWAMAQAVNHVRLVEESPRPVSLREYVNFLWFLHRANLEWALLLSVLGFVVGLAVGFTIRLPTDKATPPASQRSPSDLHP